MSRHPELKWAQREDKVYITVLLADAKDAKVNLEEDGTFTFSATGGSENHLYEIKLGLFDKVNVEESKISIGTRSIFCVVEKAEKGWWKKLLRGSEKTPHYVKVDWDKWVDEDEDPAEVNTEGMDFSKLGDMGGMESMMGGMGGMESMMGGMGGMGRGMGGMGGGMGGMDFSKLAAMGGGMDFSKLGGMGMEGMGDDDDDNDDQDHEVAKPGGEAAEAKEPSEEKVEAAPST